jgi:peptidoglycan/LPS O-acetylase OafA/YrhL/putative flippase GtrA
MNKAKLKRLFSYGVVGVIVSTIYVLCTIFFTETIGFTPIIASALAYITSFMLSFFANHHIVFKSKENMSKTVIRFAVVSAFVFVFSTSIIYLTVEVFKIPYLYGVAVVLVLIPLSNYVLNLSWTFREVNKNEDIMYGSVLFTMRLYLFFKCIMHTFMKKLLLGAPYFMDYKKIKPLSTYCIDRNNNFNLLRLIAASLVIFGHCYATFGPPGTPDFFKTHIPSITSGGLGVQIFFIISGFLIVQSFINKPHVIEFLAARVLRIFPGLWVALLLTVLLGAFMTTLPFVEYFNSPKVWDYFLSNAMLHIRFELPGVFEVMPSFPKTVNGSLWTLPKEFSLYIILLFVGAGGCLSSRGIINLICAFAVFMHLQQAGTYYLTNGLIPVNEVIFCFMIGVLFYANREFILISFRLTAILFLLTTLSVKYGYYTFVTVQVFIAYLVFIIAYHEKLQLPIFRRNDYSYGLYIYAFPLQQALAQLNITKHFSLYILLCFAVILPFAIFSWHIVEKPSLRLKESVCKLFQFPSITN